MGFWSENLLALDVGGSQEGNFRDLNRVGSKTHRRWDWSEYRR